MAASPRTPGSFGELARRAVSHPGWPPEVRLEARSFASILSKLDRGHELDWLRDREAVQIVLAEVLERPRIDLRPRGPAPPAGEPERLLRLEDVRFAAAVDVAREHPCPGLPEPALDPSGWERLHWSAPSGAGRSLAGAWLAATGRAAWVRAERPADLSSTRAEGAVFVEVPVRPAGVAWAAALDSFCQTHPRCCLASPGPAPDERWRTITSAPPAAWLEALARWVARRLPEGSRLEASSAAAWVLREPVARGMAEDLGAVLGWLGLIDELGLDAASRHGPRELARRWVRQRMTDAVGELGGNPAWLRRHAFDVLTGMVRRALTDSDLAVDAPRAAEEWLALVPDEFRSEADATWLHTALVTEGGLPRAAVERAAARLPPGAWRQLSVLRQARLLVPDATGHERLRPRWLLGVLRDAAVEELVQGPAEELGEALLRGHGAAPVLSALGTAAHRASAAWVERIVELDVASPGTTAALEAAVTACGAALLQGADLPSEAVDALLDDQLTRVVALPEGVPSPSVPHRVPGAAPGAVDSPERWLLGLLALAEHREGRRSARAFLERTWASPLVHARLGALAVELPSEGPEGERRLTSGHAFELVDRLRGWLGPTSADDAAPTPWELPSVVLDGLTLGVVEWARVEALAEAPGLPALAALAARRRVPWGDVASAIWRAWAASEAPWPGPWSSDAAARHLWPHLPVDLGVALAAPGWQARPRRWDLMPPAAAEAAARALSGPALADWSASELEGLASAGPALSLPLLVACAAPGVVEAAWARAPQAMLAALPEVAAAGPELALRHLRAVPTELGGVAVRALLGSVTARSPLAEERRRWNALATGWVATRGPGWREAHAWLTA